MAVRSNTTGALLALAFITFVGVSFLVMAVLLYVLFYSFRPLLKIYPERKQKYHRCLNMKIKASLLFKKPFILFIAKAAMKLVSIFIQLSGRCKADILKTTLEILFPL